MMDRSDIQENTQPSLVDRPYTPRWKLPALGLLIGILLLSLWWYDQGESQNTGSTSQPSTNDTSLAVLVPTRTPTAVATATPMQVAAATASQTSVPPTERPISLPTPTPTTGGVTETEAATTAGPPVADTESVTTVATTGSQPITLETVALPTVTPTVSRTQSISRRVNLTGNATLRLALENDKFTSSGQPLELALEPRAWVLSTAAPRVTDQWCTQLGVSSLVFDVVLRLDPGDQSVAMDGSVELYDGFCDDTLGAQRAATPLSVDIPADAAAQIVQSLQAESSLFNTENLLNIDTGVFIELTIRNPRQP